MGILLDLTDRLARFPIAYSWQPVRGWAVKHFDDVLNQSVQRTKQNALGEGPWDALEKLWADAFEIPETDYHFHSGMGDDAPDTFFPSDAPHPWTAYVSAKCRDGLDDSQTDKLFGIYRTLRTPNYNGAGQQLNAAGVIVTPPDPRNEYFFKPNPANASIDQLLRWGKRLPDVVNFPAWVDWRDYNDELIPWDDSKYTPRSLSLTPAASGSLIPGTTYYIRVSTIKVADESSASSKTLESKADSITLLGGQTSFQVNWLIKGDELTPPAPPTDQTEYRIYIGTVPNVWLGYFVVAGAALRTFSVTTIAGVTAGIPRDIANTGLLRDIKRFECGLFFIPPYDLAQSLDRICQISCADWQWSGLGTGTYRNDKIRFMSPATRTPVFTLNLAETGMGSFQTFPVDRRNRPNQIIVNFRDRDDEFLSEGQPVILDRDQLQIDDKQVKPFNIDGGTMYRSQAQRCASFYARVLCDLDQMANMIASPKSYHVLPGDVVFVTNDTPDWEDVQFMVRRKEENVEGNIGDLLGMQLYTPGMYSDTDYSPLPRALPAPRVDPFIPPPIVSNVVLSQRDTIAPNGLFIFLHGEVQFAVFRNPQIGRVWWFPPGGSGYEPTHITLIPDPITLQASFELPGALSGLHKIKVVTESSLGASLDFADHPFFSITINIPATEEPTDLNAVFDLVGIGVLVEWLPGTTILISPDLESYDFEVRNAANTATLRSVVVNPSKNVSLSEFVSWQILYDPPEQVHLLENGGFSVEGIAPPWAWELESRATASTVGGLFVEWQIESLLGIAPMVLLYPEDVTPDIANVNTFYWDMTLEVDSSLQGYHFEYRPEGVDVSSYQLVTGDRFGIKLREDGIVEYYLNYLGPSSIPLYTSGRPIKSDTKYRLKAMIDFDFIGYPNSLLYTRWVRQGPEWYYNSAAQVLDGVNSDDEINIRIRQKSPYVNGLPSNWAEASLVRP